jgi:hypothetical protein
MDLVRLPASRARYVLIGQRHSQALIAVESSRARSIALSTAATRASS